MRFFTQLLSVVLAPTLAVGPLGAQAADVTASEIEIHVVDSDGPTATAGSHSAKGWTVLVTNASGTPVPDAAVVVRLPESGPTGAFTDGSHSAVAYTDGAGRAHVADVQWSNDPGAMTIKLTATKGVVHAGTLLEENLTAAGQKAVSAPVAAPSTPSAKAPSLATPSLPIVVHAPSLEQTPPMLSPAPIARVAPASEVNPSVSITNNPGHEKVHSGSSKTKWIILAVAIAAGAGAGAAMMGGHSSSSTSTPSSSVTIGTPTVSVGAP
jgi:hypothetical protein